MSLTGSASRVVDCVKDEGPKPSVATPRAQLKRKHDEIIDLYQPLDHDKHERLNAAAGRGTKTREVMEIEDEEEDGSDVDSLYQDILDDIELDPYTLDGDDDVTKEEAQRLHRDLRRSGPEAFLKHHLSSGVTTARMLGSAFGINPTLAIDDDDLFLDVLQHTLQRAYKKRQKLSQYNTIDDAAKLLRTKKNIMVITGAGISTSLGIPDFRSQGTGFYDKVRALGYGGGEDVFQIEEFDRDPSIFYSLAGDILPDLKRFSPTHAFLKLLQTKNRLQTNYTQNIDNLEELAGIDKSRLIQCHGSFATASCRKCKNQVPGRVIFDDIRAKRVAKCKRCIQVMSKQPSARPPLKKRKPKSTVLRKNDWEDSSDDDNGTAYDLPQPGIMKPDITFFGEKLPDTFFDRFMDEDRHAVDLVIVIGTSLKVAPVSEMCNHLPAEVPHIYISREPIEHVNFDIQLLGESDHVVFELCKRTGWGLRHEMLPEGLRVGVEEVEGYESRWTVSPLGGAGVSSRGGTPTVAALALK
ncbi:hypothetical protein LTR62_000420 [Meristemomyces frigidus]|uniref:Deacetylase sirtuin-type domain-containing protein n=1 Tax=Meristemomyces frigidus TaxID=1508187 RepID=A0AAN7TGM9_9PEZI|nr:hypothetical protein LTR62_000420 [Meristemomyces frigidus]